MMNNKHVSLPSLIHSGILPVIANGETKKVINFEKVIFKDDQKDKICEKVRESKGK